MNSQYDVISNSPEKFTYSTRHIFAFIFVAIGISFFLVEILSPFYFDRVTQFEGLKLAGKLSGEFEKEMEQL